MTNEIVLSEPVQELGPVLQKAEEYVRQSKSANTRTAYANDWQHFQNWCTAHRVASLPASPETVALYIADMAESSKPSTIKRHLASISVAHQAKGLKSPNSLLVQTTMAGIRRVKGITKDKKSPVRVSHLLHLSDVLPKGLQGIRDKAIFLIGYAGAFRRSELVDLDIEDVRFEPEGVRISVRHSKTDQESIGQAKDINYAGHSTNCPVKALKKWIEMGSIESGPLFRPVNRHGQVLIQRLSPQSIALVVKRVMQALRMDPDQFSGHSLRAGFVTDAIKHGIQSQVIRRVTGHKSESTLAEYFREADTFDYNIVAKLGL
jgi:site-specific recombinase XerD